MLRLGIDIGGTFTDFTLIDPSTDEATIDKEPTTEAQPERGALRGAKRILSENDARFEDLESVLHGTTLVSNTVIERTGAKTGLLATAGTRDSLELRTGLRYDMSDWKITYPEPLVPRHRRLEVDERIDAAGNVVESIDREAVYERVSTLVEDHGVDAIAVSFLHSYLSGEHERAVAEVVEEHYPDVHVSLSSEVAPVVGEYLRTSTTVLNAYVAPVVENYVETLESDLRTEGFDGNLYMMTSTGGVVGTAVATAEPVRLIESGPAAGVLASKFYAREYGWDDVFSFDMGGTTAKGSAVQDDEVLINYQDDVAREYRFEEGSGYHVVSPLIDLTEIGAGGGSIASVTEHGTIEVGPESAGAEPGPVCYDQGGTEPTVTDALLLLGYLNPENFLGGRIDLAEGKAEEVFSDRLADPLDISVPEAAWHVYDLVSTNMASAFRRYTSSRGIDISGLRMVATGGAGPTHAHRIADAIGIDEIVCPYGAGVGSSIGLTEAPKLYEASSSRHGVVAALDAETIRAEFRALREEAEAALAKTNADIDDTETSISMDMRHVQQGYEIKVPFPEHDLEEVTPEIASERFAEVYREQFNRDVLDHPIEVRNYHLQLSEPTEAGLPKLTGVGGSTPSPSDREMYFQRTGRLEAPVHAWNDLDAGERIDGPVVVEATETTAVVGPDSTLEVKPGKDLLIDTGDSR
ncbi:hydantoinase/oxoprolinase family protein [Natronomonas marina]|uniref:hydantoinase/oxoprolinase family protein n=1 Tax=Natronomonas marina TaxID=2961939 RepID=UPI0020C9E940|nr:hydantoinase/oxoprolinase family protein [Natronomonas marina]